MGSEEGGRDQSETQESLPGGEKEKEAPHHHQATMEAGQTPLALKLPTYPTPANGLASSPEGEAPGSTLPPAATPWTDIPDPPYSPLIGPQHLAN